MKNTTHVGNVTEGMVLSALLRRGKRVLTPFGGGSNYDLLIDEGDKFTRVQCKTGKVRHTGSVVVFKNYTTLRGGKVRSYGKTVDAYGVYCPQNGKVYLVPAGECATQSTYLRLTPPKHVAGNKVLRFAAQFEL